LVQRYEKLGAIKDLKMDNVKSNNGWDRYFPQLVTTDKAGDSYAIERKAESGAEGKGARVQRVVFARWNDNADVEEEVTVYWKQAFKWADHDKCGGRVVAVLLADDRYEHDYEHDLLRRVRAESRWFNKDDPTVPVGSDGQRKCCLASINLPGGYGEIMRRDYDISRDLEALKREAARLNTTALPLAQATVIGSKSSIANKQAQTDSHQAFLEGQDSEDEEDEQDKSRGVSR
jgi:hypothetical protein